MQAIILVTALIVSHPPVPEHVERPGAPEWANLTGEIANIDPLFISAVAWVESRHNVKAAGDYLCRKKAEDGVTCLEKKPTSFGIFQIKLTSCKGYFRFCRKSDLFNTKIAAVVAGMLWRRILRRHSRKKAAVVYNCGPSRCGRGKRMMKHTPATKAYFKTYKRFLKKFETKKLPAGQ